MFAEADLFPKGLVDASLSLVPIVQVALHLHLVPIVPLSRHFPTGIDVIYLVSDDAVVSAPL